jgi:hypothetical protein
VKVISELYLSDENHSIVNVINFEKPNLISLIDAVIMAGGRGQRLQPFTIHPETTFKRGDKQAIMEHNLVDWLYLGLILSVKIFGEQITLVKERKEYKNRICLGK